MAFSGCLTAFLTRALIGLGLPAAPAISLAVAATCCVCLAVGCFTGFIRARFRVPTFITTLAWMTILTGAAELITDGFPIAPFPEWYNFFGGGYANYQTSMMVFNHVPGGSNVLYMDGHVEWERYDDQFPVMNGPNGASVLPYIMGSSGGIG